MNPLEHIMGLKEAAAMWGLAAEEVARLCREGQVQAALLDGEENVWVLVKNQPAPACGGKTEQHAPRPGASKASLMSSRLRDALLE